MSLRHQPLRACVCVCACVCVQSLRVITALMTSAPAKFTRLGTTQRFQRLSEGVADSVTGHGDYRTRQLKSVT